MDKYTEQLEQALVTLRVMYDNVEMQRVIDHALKGTYDMAWYSGFKDAYRKAHNLKD